MRVTPSTRIEIGRLIQAIEDLGELDNTIVIYIAGDNGGTAVGGLNGTFNEWSNLNSAPEDIPYLLSRLDEYGGPNSYPNYAVVGYGRVYSRNLRHQCLPRRWTESGHGDLVAQGFKSKGEVRKQYTHLIDVGPTILEARHP